MMLKELILSPAFFLGVLIGYYMKGRMSE